MHALVTWFYDDLLNINILWVAVARTQSYNCSRVGIFILCTFCHTRVCLWDTAVLVSTPHCVFELKTPNNLSSVLMLSISPNSWQLLERANDLAMESWDFDSWSQLQLQVPPPAPTPLQARAPPQLPQHHQRGPWNPTPAGRVSRLHIQGCPPCTLSSPLPSKEMPAKVSENIGMWKVDTLKLCEHNKPCRAFLQVNPHHHPLTHTTYPTASHGHNLYPTVCTPSPTSLLSLLYLQQSPNTTSPKWKASTASFSSS